MPPPPRSRLLAGAPRWLLGLVIVLAVAQVTVSLPGPGNALGVGDGVRRALALALQLATVAVLVWRSRAVALERTLWRRLAAGSAVLAVGVLTSALLAGLLPGPDLADLPMAWAPMLSFPLVYGGLVGWNRYSTSVADPNDTINGVSAVLAVIAVGNAVLAGTGTARTGSAQWIDQELLAWTATTFVVLGTALSVAFIAAIARDLRPWLLAGGLVAEFGAAIGGLVAHDPWVGWAGAAVAAACTCIAAVLRPPAIQPQPTDPAATTIGAFVVIVCSTAVLVVCALGTASTVATWCAGLAAAGSSIRLLLNVRDLSQLAISRKEALTDELTGLANRRAVLRRVRQVGESGDGLVLALLDLDKFKEVNDALGHSAGDDLLRLVAQRLEPSLTSSDVIGRLGGDEFAVVGKVPRGRTAAEHAAVFGELLRSAFAEPFEVGGLTLHVAVSIGVAHSTAGQPAPSRSRLLREADAAMYDAKRSGRGVTVYDPTRHADSSGHLALVEEMRSGLVAGEFVLHHQPQLDIATGRTVGVEALVRWQHPARGLLGPAEFLPLAEVHGLMGALTDTVLAQAVAQAAAWRRQGLELRMSVNLSASNLLDTHLPQRVAGLLAAHDVPPSAIVLEVTESVLLSDPERSFAVVAALAALGTAVSIDDFGTGYGSLTYLRHLPVTELKLDRSFTADLLTDSRAAAIISSTIGLAHQLGLRVVAEGVEDDATLSDLRLLGCDESQGYLHARPLPAAALEEWLAGQGARPTAALLP
jgi:diguanylate cyclase (GGDEF)-like protein